ncbi:MAG: hypothetical protein OCC45_13345 [Desulfotalea sp.]
MAEKTKFNHMHLQGKIVGIETFGEGDKKRYKHQVVTKAKDEFTSPSGIIVTSTRMMGTEGQVVECEVEYGGYIKPVKWTDKNTGELKEMKNLNAYFTEVINA